MEKPSVSIIVPITRKNDFLPKILELKSKKAEFVEIILVIDNPCEKLIDWARTIANKASTNVIIEVNEANIGAPMSRNKGIELSKGSIVLFLDDDVMADERIIDHHISEIQKGEYLGCIGNTRVNFDLTKLFQYAVYKSGFTYSFSLCKDYTEHSWGPTCNLSIVKSYIKGISFDTNFPRCGGGEDVDFCWQIRNKEPKKTFKVSESVKAVHPAWIGLKNNYRRFFRWGYADVLLFKKNSAKKYRDYPNLVEIYFFYTLLTIIFSIVSNSIYTLCAVFSSFILSFVMCSVYETKNTESSLKAGFIIQSIILIHDIGRMTKILRKFSLGSLCYRTQYFDEYNPSQIRLHNLKKLSFIILSNIISYFTLVILI